MTRQNDSRHRGAAVFVVAVATTVAFACGGGKSNSDPPPAPATGLPALGLTRAFPALTFSSPVAMLQAPGDDTRWFVVERGGRVIAFPNNDSVTPPQVSQFVNAVVDTTGEGGLLGMAFHPDFPATPHVYLSYTRKGPDARRPLISVIARFASNDGGATLDPASEVEILTLEQPFTNHNGGQIAFDRFGKLFIGFGDGGSGGDPLDSGQRLDTLLGKMLRIDIDSAPAAGNNYAIPADNPFAAGGGLPEIYAWGFRNPWRWSFDRATGRLWLGDVGQGTWEEVDIVEGGRNYGWRVCEGAHLSGTATPCNNAAFVDPIAEYGHALGCSVTGGYVYRGTAIPGLSGIFLFGDVCSGRIWGVRESHALAPLGSPLIASGLSVVSFGESNDGELYVVDLNGGLHRIIAAP